MSKRRENSEANAKGISKLKSYEIIRKSNKQRKQLVQIDKMMTVPRKRGFGFFCFFFLPLLPGQKLTMLFPGLLFLLCYRPTICFMIIFGIFKFGVTPKICRMKRGEKINHLQQVPLGFIILAANEILLKIVIFMTNQLLDSQIFASFITCLLKCPNSPLQFSSSVNINHVRLITLKSSNEVNSMTFTVPFSNYPFSSIS